MSPSKDRGRVRVRTSVERKHTGDGPLVEATLGRHADPATGDDVDALAPLRLPEVARVLLRDIDARLVRGGSARVLATLASGSHAFPLAEGPGFQVVVAPGTIADVRIEVGDPPRGAWSEGPVIRSLGVDIHPAIVLPNVLQTLVDLRHLFEDRTFEAARKAWDGPLGRSLRKAGTAALRATGIADALWTSFDDATGLAPFLLDRARTRVNAVGRAFADGAMEPGEVHLSRVRGRPRWNPSDCRWELELAFSGQVRLLDRVTWPFDDVVLPSSILPVPFASLDGLLSGEPLATGILFAERVDPRAVVKAMWGVLASAEGEIEGEGMPPVLGLATTLVDRTEVVLRGALPETCRLRACFVARRDEGSLRVDVPEAEAEFPEGSVKARCSMRLDLDFETTGMGLPKVPSGHLKVEALPGSSLPWFEGRSRSSHPLAVGSSSVRVRIEDVRPSGGLEVDWGDGGAEVRLRPEGVAFEARVSMPRQDAVRLPDAGLGLELRDGTLAARLKPFRDGPWRASVRGGCIVEQRGRAEVVPIPELHIEDPVLRNVVEAGVRFDLSANLWIPRPGAPEFRLTPKGRLDVVLRRATATLDGRGLEVPEGTTLSAAWREGEISSEGLGAFAVDLGWDLLDRPIRVTSPDGREVLLKSDPLVRGGLAVHVSPGGRLSIRTDGKVGMGAGWMSTLVGGGGSGALQDLLWSGEALDLLSQVLDLFDNDLARLVVKARDAVRSGRRHIEEEGIHTAGDAIPRPRIARLLSRFLCGNTSFAPRLEPLVQDVTEGRGIHLRKAKALIAEAVPDLDADYEVDRLLRWVDLVTRPGALHPRTPPREEAPIDLDPRYASAVADLASAATIYAAAERPRCPEALQRTITELAPELTLAQLDWILARTPGRWMPSLVRRLRHVRAAKRAVARIDAEASPLASAAKAATIAGFLGEVVGPLAGLDDGSSGWPPPCALGPVDVAVLLHVGLSDQVLGLQSQVNNRLLLELIRSRPGDFLRAVLVEMSQQVPHILAGVLMAFLNQDQQRMKEPLDLPGLVQDKLGLPVPRLADYMAGGRHVRDSYYGALSALANAIVAEAGPYLARRTHLREVHHPVPPPLRVPAGPRKRLEDEARALVSTADRRARRLRLDGRDKDAAIDAARAGYRDSFAACAAFLREVPTGFLRPWLKDFWRRNEEALKVLSVVDNVREDVDDVRHWLEVTSGAPIPADEPALVDAVVDTLYALPADRAVLKSDPLVRLLIRPEPGRYDFTVVSAMGVVTDGAEGRELQDAYDRLLQRRGVRVVRADTGLFRSLEHNASAILRGITSVEGPWGWIGYSQGCANGLLAESFLRGGTPDQQRALERFVGRNLLFSAANGSVHGTCGTEKMLKAMVEGERFLKAYQARYSRQLVDLFLKALQAVLDSRQFVETVGGAHSLTIERAIALHRDGQFVPWVPTSTTIAQVSRERLPEALEWLYFMHEHQNPGVLHDSQVPSDEAQGHATRVVNERTEAFARCDIGSFVQATHHWSPLTVEIEAVTTERDRTLAVYQGPKDRHVLPWVEAHARFGRIRRID